MAGVAWTKQPGLVAGVDALLAGGATTEQVRDWLAHRGHALSAPTLRKYLSTIGLSEKYPYKAKGRIRGGGGAKPSTSLEEGRDFTSDKQVGVFSWRRANRSLIALQEQLHGASSSQDHATVEFSHLDTPICVLALSDLHFGSWGADYETLERVTDELLSTDGLYAILLGDELELAIKLRSVAEVAGNALPPRLQYAYLESWLEEVQHKILASVWSNHDHEREERALGMSVTGQILGKRCIHHSGIGHLDLALGGQVYRFALSHVFRGRSMYNSQHGQMRYGRHEGHDRDIILAGDSHTPGITVYWEAGRRRVAINGGTAQTHSPYARRYFSLTTAAVWPCIELDPAQHRCTPYWSVAEWLRATGRAT